MKKLLLILGMAAFVGCDTDKTKTETTTTETTSSDNAAKYKASEGDVTYRDGKVMVWRNNDWEVADRDVEMENGVVVYRNGRVVRDDKEVELEDGVVIDRDGNFFDKAGNAIENGWKDAKQGVKKGYNEAKEEVKDVFRDDDKKKQ